MPVYRAPVNCWHTAVLRRTRDKFGGALMPGSLLPRLGGVAAIVGGALNLARYTRDRAFSFGRTTTRPRPPAPCPRAFRTGTDPAATVTTGRSLSIVMSFPCRRWELRRTVTGLRGKHTPGPHLRSTLRPADRAFTVRHGQWAAAHVRRM